MIPLALQRRHSGSVSSRRFLCYTARWPRRRSAICDHLTTFLHLRETKAKELDCSYMPKYFFHTTIGTAHQDEEGAELPNFAEAQILAITIFGEIVNGSADEVLDNKEAFLRVSDEDGLTLMELTLFVTNSPAIRFS